MSSIKTLTIKRFAQIENISLGFGDLTVLVGAQGTGKSLALQWLKVAIDGKQVVSALKDAGQQTSKSAELVDLIFGVGMGPALKSNTRVEFDSRQVSPASINRIGSGIQRMFFIPAHRSMLISDGWAAPFQKLTSETPVVARIFSQNLFDRFSAKGGDQLFPLKKLLKKEIRDLINKAVYHDGKVGLDQDQQHTKRLKLTHGSANLPFMTWTTGQREFTPLLLGLYHLLPKVTIRKREDIDWVVVEEPEMGLHPQALTAFMLLVLDLLWRGYRVVLSTHSSHVLTCVWMLQRLKENNARWQLLLEAMEAGNSGAMKAVALSAMEKKYCVYLMEYGPDGKVHSSDISGLDPNSENEIEAGWGGLTGFSSRFGDAVRKSVIEQDEKQDSRSVHSKQRKASSSKKGGTLKPSKVNPEEQVVAEKLAEVQIGNVAKEKVKGEKTDVTEK
jgi:hypothetical protein